MVLVMIKFQLEDQGCDYYQNIESDAYSYTPDKKYDLILIDLWWDKADITQQNETDLKNNYNSHLESNGKIVLPVAEKEL